MPKFGPIVIKGDYEDLDGDLSAFGPISVHGNLKIRSCKSFGPTSIQGSLSADFVRTHGPLMVKDELVSNALRVNGPVQVKGQCLITSGSVNGPFKIGGDIKAIEGLKVNGPFKAASALGGEFILNGPINVQGVLAATESISISVGFGQSDQVLQAEKITAPVVHVSRPQLRWPKFLARLLGKTSDRIPEINVPIVAEKVILNGVKHVGLIESKNILLENGAEYTALLE
ncbi:MAG: hypothetical protein ACXAD7_09285 [Candidatus Kariarchaeaceae archaeon]|jgi:hypothetical protein